MSSLAHSWCQGRAGTCDGRGFLSCWCELVQSQGSSPTPIPGGLLGVSMPENVSPRAESRMGSFMSSSIQLSLWRSQQLYRRKCD